MERKLTAILAADVAGYSRLMGADEEETLRTLTTYREEMVAIIRQHHGRLVGTAGDSILAEFASVVDAVQCAVVIQATLRAGNASLPPDRRMQFRIGINLGDVMVDGEQIYGDGVNIAARLEALAEPGGICISGTVHEHIKNKLALEYEDLGEQMVKNIAEPVRVLKVMLEVPSPLVGEGQGEGATGRAGAAKTPHPNLFDSAQDRLPPQGRKEPQRPAQGLQEKRLLGTPHRAWVVVAGLVLIVGVIVTVRFLARPPLSPQSSALSPQAEPALPLPDNPSLVVLPFDNLSKDPEQEYFSDGFTEDLTSDLSKISSLFVISRNTAFTYKGKAVKLPEVSRELGVRYVVEGSVRKAGDQVRVTAQLIDATRDQYLWSGRYDRPLKDIFALQDEIRQQIVAALRVEVQETELERMRRTPTENLTAYDYFLRGLEYFLRITKESNAQARQMFEKAIELDPRYAEAYAALGWIYQVEWVFQWSPDPQTLERAIETVQQAIALDESLPVAHRVLSYAYLVKKQPAQAVAEAERAVTLDPNDADSYWTLANTLTFTGRPQEAIGLVEKAMRLNPRYPAVYLHTLGVAYRSMGRYAEAIDALKKAIIRLPNSLITHAQLAAAYSELGREEEARAEAAEVLRLNPYFSIEGLRQGNPYKDPAEAERYLDALRRAGMK